MKNPEVMHKAQQEVDTVVGKGPVTFQHMSKLPYLEAILRESLRLEPTAPAFTVHPIPGTTEPVLIGGEKYLIPPNAPIAAILPQIGRDPTVYGADAAEFKPERMYKEAFDKLPPNSWKVRNDLFFKWTPPTDNDTSPSVMAPEAALDGHLHGRKRSSL
jgi:cytochrome P450 / NADPH-cytochrome P450 reductase